MFRSSSKTLFNPSLFCCSFTENHVKPVATGMWKICLIYGRRKCKLENSFKFSKQTRGYPYLVMNFQHKILPSFLSSGHELYEAIYANTWTFPKSLKHFYEPINSYRYFSSTKMKETKEKVSKKMEEIKENVITVPNGLCVLRMAATPFLGYLVLQEWYATSLGLFIFAGFTDVIDGYIARNFPSQQSMIGSFLDPAADKILIATLFITLTMNGLIPVPLTSLIILRDACLMGAGFYIRYVTLPPPKTITRYFDMSFVTAKLSPTGISKVNTLVQLSLVACSLAAPVFGFIDHIYLQTLCYVTAVSTIMSAGSYLMYKDTYKVLTSAVEKRRKK